MPSRRNLCAVLLVALTVIASHTVYAATPASLERKALAAMERGTYDEAAEILAELIERVPAAPRPLYNLACCKSRLGDPEGAAESLRAAWEVGFRDLELIQSDADLEKLRSTRQGRRLIGNLEKADQRERRLRGSPLLFEAGVLASSRVVTPDVMRPDHRYPLVVVLHGNGGSGERFAGLFVAAGLSPDAIVVAPQGPYPTHQLNGFGYSWFPSVELFEELTTQDPGNGETALTDRVRDLALREREVSRSYVLAAIDTVLRDYPVASDRIYVLGFSQGGVLAYDLAFNEPGRFSGLIAVGTYLREEIVSTEALSRAKGRIRALVCHSPQDEAVPIGEGKAASKRLRAAAIDSRFVRYEGGHVLSAELLATVVRWIEGTALDQGSTGESPP